MLNKQISLKMHAVPSLKVMNKKQKFNICSDYNRSVGKIIFLLKRDGFSVLIFF